MQCPTQIDVVSMTALVRRFWEEEARRDHSFAALGASTVLEEFYGRIPQFGPAELNGLRGCRVLDIGCGWGRLILPLAKKNAAIGLDISTVMARLAKKNATHQGIDLSVVVGDAAHLPFRGRSIDVSISYLVLQHLSKAIMNQALRESARVLKEDGTLLAYLPNMFGLDGLASKIFHDFLKVPSHWGPAKVQYYHLWELRHMFMNHFRSVHIVAREFRPPWPLYNGRVLVPSIIVPFLKWLSHSLELLANSADIIPLKALATGLAIRGGRAKQ